MRYDGDLLTEDDIIHRNRLRRVYSSDEGRMELFNLFHDFGLFRVIRPEELDARNRMILKAQEIGMLDESIVREFIDHYFSLPVESMERKRTVRNKEKDIYDVPDAGRSK